jgi:hypothetical protein
MVKNDVSSRVPPDEKSTGSDPVKVVKTSLCPANKLTFQQVFDSSGPASSEVVNSEDSTFDSDTGGIEGSGVVAASPADILGDIG